MAAGLRSLDIPFLDGKMFKQVIMSCTRDLVINFVNFSVGYEVTIKSHLLLDCTYGSLDVPDELIY